MMGALEKFTCLPILMVRWFTYSYPDNEDVVFLTSNTVLLGSEYLEVFVHVAMHISYQPLSINHYINHILL